MLTRPLANTGLKLPVVSFGASSLGQEFRQIDLGEAIKAVHAALDCGMNFIDTSPFYGRGMSEVLLGVALRGVPRERYLLGSKLGRYTATHFDFSARRVVESVETSLLRMGVEHLDICLCHDIEFVDMKQIVDTRGVQRLSLMLYFKYLDPPSPTPIYVPARHRAIVQCGGSRIDCFVRYSRGMVARIVLR
jgi:aryl-alcohol dehydrogenase-like predicted oxidoreductase